MKHFIKPDASIHAFDDDYEGEYITADMQPISDAELAALRAPSLADLKAQALAQARLQRQPILSVLDGMQSSANFKGENAKAAALETAKQGLKDLTKIDLSACVTADDFKAKIMQRYREIAAALPADLRGAFAEALK
jgi:hypothetical protein